MSDTTMPGRVRELVNAIVAGDDKDEQAAAAEVQTIFQKSGLPEIARVGDEAAYEFVWLACFTGDMEQQRRVLTAARKGARQHKIPEDAAMFCASHLRREQARAKATQLRPEQPALRDQIERLFKTDQAVRQKENFDLANMVQVDRDQRAAIEEIFAKYRVPTYRMVGPQAASDFVVMVQHQTTGLRRKVLPSLKANVDAGQADPDSYAMVVDRARTEAGEKQLYGQNLVCDTSNPKLHLAPIENENGVDRRRAAIGLIRLKLYVELALANSPEICSAK